MLFFTVSAGELGISSVDWTTENYHFLAYYSHVIFKPVKQTHYRPRQAYMVPGG
jgi:hypothetical protein